MKTSSANNARPTISVQTAWGCLTANLAMPGTGSVTAGRRVSGVIQTAFALIGVTLTVIFSIRFFIWYARNHARLQDLGIDDPLGVLVELWFAVRWAVIGIGLFITTWLWSLTTSLGILRQAKRREAPVAKPAPPKL